MLLKRYHGNPILSPNPANPWEDLAVFNPAAAYDHSTRRVTMLCRAAESHPEYKCYFGLAASAIGIIWKTSLVTTPIYLVPRNIPFLAGSIEGLTASPDIYGDKVFWEIVLFSSGTTDLVLVIIIVRSP